MVLKISVIVSDFKTRNKTKNPKEKDYKYSMTFIFFVPLPLCYREVSSYLCIF